MVTIMECPLNLNIAFLLAPDTNVCTRVDVGIFVGFVLNHNYRLSFYTKNRLLMYSSTPWENVIENIFGLQEKTFNCIIAKNSPLIVNKVLWLLINVGFLASVVALLISIKLQRLWIASVKWSFKEALACP